MIALNSSLVDTDWLAANLNEPDLIVLDASVPPVVPGYISHNRDGHFSAIPGSRRFDYDQVICKPGSSLPHMMPSSKLFQDEVRKLGVNEDSVIVVYDDVGLYASPRAWWMFRSMGHKKVAALDGGLPKWLSECRDETDKYLEVDPGNFIAKVVDDLFFDFEGVLRAVEDSGCAILDARSSGRFKGLEPEPRPGIRSGHIPNSENLPFSSVLTGGELKSRDELRSIFAQLVSDNQKVITSCGSGVTACILTLAAEIAGYDNLAVYDGSWAEWGLPGKLPVALD